VSSFILSRILAAFVNQSDRKHTFNDLQPYVCTFENCPEPDRMFSSRTEWFEHELKLHRNEWICNACNATFATAASLKAHLEDNNADLLADAPVSAVVDWCQRAITTDQLCPLCKKSYPLKSIRNHLAKHLRKVALFSLPHLIDANPENMESTDPQRPVSDNESLENFGDPKLSEPTFVPTSSQRSVEMVTGEETKASGDDLAPPSQRSVDTKLDVEIKLPGDDNDMTTPYSTGLTFQPTIITASKTPDLLFEARNSIHNSTEMVNDPTRRFITESKLKEVVNNQLLTELFERCEWAQGVDVGEILRHYLKVVSILIWIGWNNWNHFDEFFLPLTRGVVDKDRSDDALPFDWDDTSDSFLNDHYFSMRFNKEQFMFLPIVITEGEIVKCREHSRLPFLEAKTLLGRDAFGVVTKELVAPGHFKYERSGNRNLRVSIKSIPSVKKRFLPSYGGRNKRLPSNVSLKAAVTNKRLPSNVSLKAAITKANSLISKCFGSA